MKELAIFIALIIIFGFAYMNFEAVRWTSWLILILFFVAIFFAFFVKKYGEVERAIIFRLGKFNRIAGPGWAVVIPFFEREFQKLDVRTKMVSLFIPQIFTSDDLRLRINGIVYYRIKDPEKAALKIENYLAGLKNMIVSETRNLMAGMSMRELFASLDKLNQLLADKIRHSTWIWGIDVPMVQIKEITPPEEIAVAMQKKEISAQMLQAQKFNAEARRITIEAIGEGAKKLDDAGVMYLYLKALEELGKGSATKIIFPMQFLNAMKTVGTGFGLGTGLDMGQAIDAVKSKILEAKV
jgi:regulator of protease activity HflC (stomatin/prohibitin superfamily)